MRVYKEFEEKVPISHLNVIDFWETLLKAHRSSGDNGYITINAMKQHFTKGAFATQLKDQNSCLRRLLASPAFRDNSNSVEKKIKFTNLAVYGILICPGSVMDKVNVLECIVHVGP